MEASTGLHITPGNDLPPGVQGRLPSRGLSPSLSPHFYSNSGCLMQRNCSPLAFHGVENQTSKEHVGYWLASLDAIPPWPLSVWRMAMHKWTLGVSHH